MNFVSHIEVARRLLDSASGAPTVKIDLDYGAAADNGRIAEGSTKRFMLGAALPDFASIGRFRLANRPSDQWLDLGITAHHRTDDAFHHHQWFVEHSSGLCDSLSAGGLGRGPSRAIGHVGIELLLDATLLDHAPDLDGAVRSVLGLADQPQLRLDRLVRDDRVADWGDHLSRIAGWRLVADHHSPTSITERLYRILRPRQRLAFDHDRLPLVIEALAERSQAIRGQSEAEAMVNDVVTAVGDRLND